MQGINLQPVAPAGAYQAGQGVAKSGDVVSGFGDVLRGALATYDQRRVEADSLAAGLVSGQHANIHETMIALEQSSISFRLMTKVQQKALDAYQEVMRMQL